MSELFVRQPFDYHAPEHPPEDQGWGWLIVLLVGALAVVAGVLIDWPAALAVVGASAAALIVHRVRSRRHRKHETRLPTSGNAGAGERST